jgi:2-polyprenyl-3-methyl-5-hydroxy-6-metoxy-1,4-benzoquinol methylase
MKNKHDMQRTREDQINSKQYWNYIYTTPAKAVDYWTPTRRFAKALEYVKDGDKVIDIGCGVGVLTRMVGRERQGCEVWGTDISDEIIKNNILSNPETKYLVGYAGEQKDLPSEYFDVVFSGEVIEHMDVPEMLFSEAYRILKPGGKLIVTCPKDDNVRSPEHLWYFNRDDITTFYTDAGFKSSELIDLDGTEYLVVFFALGTK